MIVSLFGMFKKNNIIKLKLSDTNWLILIVSYGIKTYLYLPKIKFLLGNLINVSILRNTANRDRTNVVIMLIKK